MSFTPSALAGFTVPRLSQLGTSVVIARTSHSDGVYTGFGIITFLLKSVSLAKLEELLNVPTTSIKVPFLNKATGSSPLKSIGAPTTLCAVNVHEDNEDKEFLSKNVDLGFMVPDKVNSKLQAPDPFDCFLIEYPLKEIAGKGRIGDF